MTNAELDDRLAELCVRQGQLTAATVERALTFQRTRSSTLAGAIATLQLVPADVLRGFWRRSPGHAASIRR